MTDSLDLLFLKFHQTHQQLDFHKNNSLGLLFYHPLKLHNEDESP